MAFDPDETAKQLSQGAVAHPGKGRGRPLKQWEHLNARVSLANDDFINSFLICTSLTGSWAMDVNIHNPCSLRVHNLVEKIECQSTMTIQGSRHCERETKGCGSSRRALTQWWEGREKRPGVTISKPTHVWEGKRGK